MTLQADLGKADRRASAVHRAVLGGRSDDGAFDALYPAAVRAASRIFWTPVAIARRAARLFARCHVERVLDVGCGPGKFCIVGALCEPSLEVVGVDHRAGLIDVASAVGRRLGVGNARFFLGDVAQVPWSEFDGHYFYNPFAENVFAEDDRYDGSVELSVDRFRREICAAEDRLNAAPAGTVIVTYHRFGGRIPSSYDLIFEDEFATGCLRAWRKARSIAAGVYFEACQGVYFRANGAREGALGESVSSPNSDVSSD